MQKQQQNFQKIRAVQSVVVEQNTGGFIQRVADKTLKRVYFGSMDLVDTLFSSLHILWIFFVFSSCLMDNVGNLLQNRCEELRIPG